MAFLSNEKRQFQLHRSAVPENVGPGKYELSKQYTAAENPSAFNSNSQRQVFQESQTPGPGEYNVKSFTDQKQREFNQFVSKKVVLQSGNSDVFVYAEPDMSCNFKSTRKRFEEKKEEITPGPGHYESASSFQNDQKSYAEQSTLLTDLIKLHRNPSIPSIPGKQHSQGYLEDEADGNLELNRPNDMAHTGDKHDSVGPGDYELTIPYQPAKGTTWHLSKTPKILDMVTPDKATLVGPGHYDLALEAQSIYKSNPSSTVVSQSQRLFDQRYGFKKTKFMNARLSEQKLKYNEAQDQDSSQDSEYNEDATPGPGYYQLSTASTFGRYAQNPIQKKNGCGFGSQVKRYLPLNSYPHKVHSQGRRVQRRPRPVQGGSPPHPRPQLPEPASLQHLPGTSSKAHSSQPRAFLLRVQRLSNPIISLTPQQFQDRLIKKMNFGALGRFGVNVERFQESEPKRPEPGQYEIPGLGDRYSKNRQPQASFKSKVQRKIFVPQKHVQAPGAYQVENFTIEKAVRQEEFDDADLQPTKAPFNSSVARVEVEKRVGVSEEEELQMRAKNINDLFIKQNSRVPFQSSEKRFKTVSKLAPGPGEYFDQKAGKWEKESFNILYANI